MGKEITLFLDIDSVLADIHTPWLAWYNEEYDDDLTPEEWNRWELSEIVKCGKLIFHFLHLPELYMTIEPIPGALEAVKLLSDHYEIAYATSTNTDVAYQKYYWLVRHGFLPRISRTTVENYVEIRNKSLLRGMNAALIDDGPHNIEKYSGLSIVYDQPWNRHLSPAYFRLSSWEVFLEYPEVLLSYIRANTSVIC